MINYEKLFNTVKELLAVIVFMFIINVSTLVGTLGGLIIFGIFPAIFSGMIIIKNWLDGSRNYYFTKFWKEYKNNFITANLFAVIIYIMLYIAQNFMVFVYNYILVGKSYLVLTLCISLSIIMFLSIASCIIYGPLINAYIKTSFKEFFVLSFSMIVYAPINTFKVLLVSLLCAFITYSEPLFFVTIFFPAIMISIIVVSRKFLNKFVSEIYLNSNQDTK